MLHGDSFNGERCTHPSDSTKKRNNFLLHSTSAFTCFIEGTATNNSKLAPSMSIWPFGKCAAHGGDLLFLIMAVTKVFSKMNYEGDGASAGISPDTKNLLQMPRSNYPPRSTNILLYM